jgi:hypothetical protein
MGGAKLSRRKGREGDGGEVGGYPNFTPHPLRNPRTIASVMTGIVILRALDRMTPS